MTENDLIDLGFNKVIITDKESGNGFDYYYYTLLIMEGLDLVSIDSLDVIDNNWRIFNFEWPDIKSINKESIKFLIDLAKTQSLLQ